MTAAPSPPPFGKSAFQVKGVIYLGTRAFFDSQVQGGYAGLVEAIDDPALRAFFTQPFLSSSWYDVLPVAPLIEIEAKVMGLSLEDYLSRRTVFQADRDMGGVYKFLLRAAYPELVAPRLGRLLSQVFDFGKSTVTAVGPAQFRYRFDGWPVVLHRWYKTAIDIYGRRAMTLAGARSLELVLSDLTDASVLHGVQVGTFYVDLSFAR